MRLDRPVKAYDRWLRRIPTEFHRSVLGENDPVITGQRRRVFDVPGYRSQQVQVMTRSGATWISDVVAEWAPDTVVCSTRST